MVTATELAYIIKSVAHATDRAVSPERWRAKSRTTGWDVTAAVVRDPARVGAWTSHPIAVVVGCTVRSR